MDRHNGVEPDTEGAFVYYADAQAKIEALQRERDEAIRECGKESGFWGRTCARLMDKRDALQTALDAEREKMKGQSQRAEYAEGKVRELLLQQDALELNLTQLQALVRALLNELDDVTFVDSRGYRYATYKEDVVLGNLDAAIKLVRAALDATTPAPDTSIIGKCEPPSQWDPNAHVQGDIS